jgi:hypothetical protein
MVKVEKLPTRVHFALTPTIPEEDVALAALQEIEEQEGGRKMSEILSGLIWLGAKITAQEKEGLVDE